MRRFSVLAGRKENKKGLDRARLTAPARAGAATAALPFVARWGRNRWGGSGPVILKPDAFRSWHEIDFAPFSISAERLSTTIETHSYGDDRSPLRGLSKAIPKATPPPPPLPQPHPPPPDPQPPGPAAPAATTAGLGIDAHGLCRGSGPSSGPEPGPALLS